MPPGLLTTDKGYPRPSDETLIPLAPLYCNMTVAEESHPDVFTCDCGGFMWAGCGVVDGQSMNEELLMCSECNHQETVLAEKVEAAK